MHKNIRRMPSESMLNTWRFEVKYRISVLEFQKLRIAVSRFMKPDYYTDMAPRGGYTVRSLYYDTYNYKLYHEKMNGDHERIKFRLRTYSKELTDDVGIHVEMKVRKGNAMEKYRIMVPADHYRFFMLNKHWPEIDNAILQEFERYFHLWNLQPKVLVQYQRIGYEDRFGEGIRITFDNKVRGTHSDTLFPKSPVFFRDFQKHVIIMEIKCQDNQPTWLSDIVRGYGLKWVANSKFTQGIQSSRKDLYHPDGVVFIR